VTAGHSVPLPLLLAFASLALGCKAKTLALTGPFTDNFERATVGSDWNNTGADYKTTGGKLSIAGAHNHPLWLRRKLPFNVVVELDATSNSPDGDLKIELMGDGESFDPDRGRYDPTGYMFVFGGWQNSLSIVGKLGEHDAAVKASRATPKVQPGQTYHWTITKRGGFIDWKIDGHPFLQVFDPQPLGGPGHEFFGINNWETDVSYDNLLIRPAN
jgi:hypothetical protein